MGVVTNEINIRRLQEGIEALPTIMTSVANCVEAVANVQTSVRSMDLTVSGLQTRMNAVENDITPQTMLNGLFTDTGFSDNYVLQANSVAYRIGSLAVLDITLKKNAKWTPNVFVDLHISAPMIPASPNQVIVYGKLTDSALIGTDGGDDCYVFINNNGTVRINPYGTNAKEYLHFAAVYVAADV